ncbi:hypothetical protein BD560DRAFT_386870 [Blakeslea trispora]|nr:hypothetical protein BD560DRAFT_386870 [Blakeslea trispora]
MLRATTTSLIRNQQWKNQTVNCFRNYATSDDSNKKQEQPQEQQQQQPLSQRLGGTGRGRILDGATDPFAAFLANAKSPRNRNGNFTPRPRKQRQNNQDQFADAEDKPQQPRQNDNRQNDGRQNDNRQNRNKQNRKKQEAAEPNRRGGKKMNVRRSAPQEVRTRRATTFIDKDIDWSSFEATQLSTAEQVEVDDHESVLKDIQGDYGRYLGVGTDIKWSDVIEGDAVSSLVGSNSTFDIQQKTAFLAAVVKATGGEQAARK